MNGNLRSGLLRARMAGALLFAAVIGVAILTATHARSEDLKIEGLTDFSGKTPNPALGLSDYLVVKVSGTAPIDPTKYALFLNGREIAKLDDTVYRREGHALVFHLRRNSDNATAWNALLGSPGFDPLPVSVALGEKKTPPAKTEPTITGDGSGNAQFTLIVLPVAWLIFAVVLVVAVVLLVWGGIKRTTVIKDGFLPQLPPGKQPYSLARWQMAFWFTLIVIAFVFLFALLWDYNTITEQALTLMGISGATALASVAIDVTKDSPTGTANATLRALGLNSYADIVRFQQEIKDKEKALNSVPPPDAATQLQLNADIATRRASLQTCEATTAPFVSQGWFSDLTTDNNGPALHRLQVFCWTWILGIIFLIEVYRDLRMPQFSGTLLALMAVTGGTYVGFKYPEKQS